MLIGIGTDLYILFSSGVYSCVEGGMLITYVYVSHVGMYLGV